MIGRNNEKPRDRFIWGVISKDVSHLIVAIQMRFHLVEIENTCYNNCVSRETLWYNRKQRKYTIIDSMKRKFLTGVSTEHFRMSTLLFASLLFFSVAFFALAEEAGSGKNIFDDPDRDGLSNSEEALYRTDPNNKDTDGDGYSDGVEVESGYDPLKKAPGDKIVVGQTRTNDANIGGGDGKNLTQEVSDQIVSVIKTNDGADGITLEDINASVEKTLQGNLDGEIVLPEVNIDEIKIKKLPKGLKDKEEDERKKKDTLEYITVMSYLMANNSPQSFRTENELQQLLTGLSSGSVTALTSGDKNYLKQLSSRGEKLLEQMKDVEVPESMVEAHIKALKMAKYAVQLNNELDLDPNDPLGQIASLSKVQGFLKVVSDFSNEMQEELLELGIERIPLEL